MTFEQWWGKQIEDLPNINDMMKKAIARASWEAATNYALASTMQGEDEPCAFCGERCDGFAGNPSKWPIAFTHPDGTGKIKWHHTGCVQDKVFRNENV